MFSTVFFLFYLPPASIQLQTGLNLSEVLGLSPSQLLACLLAFWAELSLFYGLLWVIHQLLPYSSVNLFYLVKSSLFFFFLYSFYLYCYFRGILGKPASEHICQATMSHVWNYSGHMDLSFLLHMYFSDVPSPNPRDTWRYHYLNHVKHPVFYSLWGKNAPQNWDPNHKKEKAIEHFLDCSEIFRAQETIYSPLWFLLN